MANGPRLRAGKLPSGRSGTRLRIGTPQMEPTSRYEVGQIQRAPRPRGLVIELNKRKKKKNKYAWMEDKNILSSVISGLKAKGVVGEDGMPTGKIGKTKLSKRERALYNRMRLSAKIRRGVESATSAVEEILSK